MLSHWSDFVALGILGAIAGAAVGAYYGEIIVGATTCAGIMLAAGGIYVRCWRND